MLTTTRRQGPPDFVPLGLKLSAFTSELSDMICTSTNKPTPKSCRLYQCKIKEENLSQKHFFLHENLHFCTKVNTFFFFLVSFCSWIHQTFFASKLSRLVGLLTAFSPPSMLRQRKGRAPQSFITFSCQGGQPVGGGGPP